MGDKYHHENIRIIRSSVGKDSWDNVTNTIDNLKCCTIGDEKCYGRFWAFPESNKQANYSYNTIKTWLSDGKIVLLIIGNADKGYSRIVHVTHTVSLKNTPLWPTNGDQEWSLGVGVSAPFGTNYSVQEMKDAGGQWGPSPYTIYKDDKEFNMKSLFFRTGGFPIWFDGVVKGIF